MADYRGVRFGGGASACATGNHARIVDTFCDLCGNEIVGSILQPVAAGAVVLLGVVATILFGALPIEKALEGFAEPVVWLVLSAFFSRGQ